MKMETLAIHGGFEPDPTTKSVATPISDEWGLMNVMRNGVRSIYF